MLTREDILKMEPGRELDALVAKHVMFPRHTHPLSEVKGWCQKYSADISAAWEVVEKISKKDNVKFSIDFDYSVNGKWNAGFNYNSGSYAGNAAVTAPLAICRAALLAVAVMEESHE